MQIKVKQDIEIIIDVVREDNILKTHKCDVGDWWGEDICGKIDLSSIIANELQPEKEYKITINVELIN